MNEELEALRSKILEAIKRDVTNICAKAASSALPPEHQEALAKYYKLLSDVRIADKERELNEKIARAEEIINRGTAS